MCGIAGFLDGPGRESPPDACARMTARLNHRGPDDTGYWNDGEAGVRLGHARLSIVDLSMAGHQPMTSGDGRWVISYNGEVYNAADLRERLAGEGATFRGRSDTEVLLEARWPHGAWRRRWRH